MIRLRNEALRTGQLALFVDKSRPSQNTSLLFLIESTKYVPTLLEIEEIIEELAKALPQETVLSWHSIADQGQTTNMLPDLRLGYVHRFEVAEFTELTREELRELLAPMVQNAGKFKSLSLPKASDLLGSIARGSHFLGRRKELQELQVALTEGKHFLLIAPRRSGKTSLLYKLRETDNSPLHVHYLDLQSFQSSEEVAFHLWLEANPGKRQEAASQLDTNGWKKLLQEAILQSKDQRPEQSFVLLLDELVYFCIHLRDKRAKDAKGAKEAKKDLVSFLTTLGEVLEQTQSRTIVTGSSALEDYLQKEYTLSLKELPAPFNQMTPYILGPLDITQLHTELRRLMLGMGLVCEEEDQKELMKLIDLAMPYQAMCFLDHLQRHTRRSGPIKSEDIEAILDTFLRETDAFNELSRLVDRRYAEHLGQVPMLEAAIQHIVDAPGNGIKAQALQQLSGFDVSEWEDAHRWLLDTFPFVSEEETIQCVSKLFARWWRGARR